MAASFVESTTFVITMHYIQTNCVYNISKITLHEEEKIKKQMRIMIFAIVLYYKEAYIQRG